jgi:PAS domain S-box-containing protein
MNERLAKLHDKIELTHDYLIKTKEGEDRWLRLSSKASVENGKLCGANGTLIDITEKKIIELKLSKSEAVYRNLVESIHDVIYEISNTGIINYISPAIEKIMGYTPEELIGKSATNYMHPDDVQMVVTALANLGKSELPYIEYRYIDKTGATRWVRTSTTPIYVDGMVVGGTGSLMEITDRKNAEIESESKTKLLTNLITNLEEGILLEDSNRKIVLTNQLFCDMFAIPAPPSAMVGADCTDSAEQSKNYFKNPQKFIREINTVLSNQEMVLNQELELADGRFFERDYIPTYVDSKYSGHLWKYRDISERKLAEIKLAKSEERFQQVVEQSNEVVWEINKEGLFTYVSPISLQIYGYTPEEMIGKLHFYDLDPTDDKQNLTDIVFGIFHRKEHFTNFVSRFVKKDGTERILLTNGIPILDADGELLGYRGLDADITDRKKDEEQLQKLAQALEQSPALNYITDLAGNIEYANPKSIEVTGFSQEELIGQNPRIFGSKERKREEYIELWKTISSGQIWKGEFHNVNKNEEFYWVLSTISPIYNSEGKITHYLAIQEVITKQKEAEAEISHQITRLDAIVKAMPDLIFVVDKSGTYTEFFAPESAHLFMDRDKIVGASLRDVFDEESVKMHLQKIEECQIAQQLITYEYIANVGPNQLFFEARLTPYRGDQVLIFVRDITERKEAENNILDLNENLENKVQTRTTELAESNKELIAEIVERNRIEKELSNSEEKYRSVVENVNEVIFRTDAQGHWLFLNKSWETITGFTVDESIGQLFFNYVHPDDRQKNADLFEPLINRIKEHCRHEIRYLTKDGNFRWIEVYATLKLNSEDEIVGTFGTLQDITERKLAEDALNWNRMLMELMSDSSPLGFLVVDNRTDEILYFNNQFCKIWEIEQLAEQMAAGEFKNNDIIPYCLPVLNDIPAFAESCKPLQEESNRTVFSDEIAFTQNRTVHRYTTQIRDKNDQYFGRFYIFEDITDRKRAEADLEESLERHRGLSAAAFDSIFFSEKGVCIEQNEMAEKVFGYTNEEAIGRYGTDWIVAEDRKLVMDNMISGYDQPYQVTALRKDGTIFPCMLSGRMMMYKGRNVRVTSLSDITARKKAEEALIESESRFSLFMDVLPAIVFLKDSKGKTLFVNKYMDNAFGAATWVGKTPAEVFPKEFGEKMLADDLKTLELGYQKIEESLTQLDGTVHDFETQKFAIHREGKESLLGGVALDITDRNRITKAIEQSELRHSAMISNISDVIGIMGVDGVMSYKSPNIEHSFGWKPEDLIGTNGWLTVHPDDQEWLQNEFADLLHVPNSAKTVEYRYLCKDGSYKPIELTATNLVGNSVIEGILLNYHDITERKKTEAEIVKSKLVAEQANLAKSEFLSRMSHELRTPMNSILGFAQLMNMAELTPNFKKNVNHIINSGKHLLNLINEVLDISSIEAGKISLTVESIEVKSVILEILDVVQLQASLKNISIELIDSPVNDIHLQADRQRLRQVILNLVSNAIKYNRNGGFVKIKIEAKTTNEEGITTIRISVIDNGIGISKMNIKKLFLPFERIGAERTETEGTGLGLSVAKKLIEAMGGTVGVCSTIDKGSEFWIELSEVMMVKQQTNIHTAGNITNQTQEEADLANQLNNASSSESEARSSILYIEDNLSNTDLIIGIIESQRPSIELFTSIYGKPAVELAIAHKPSIILLDLDLPDIHGSVVLADLMENEETMHIPIVIVSADAMANQIENLIHLGAKEYLTKPINVVAFLETIDRYIIK